MLVPGEKLREMLVKHGSFKSVECEIARWQKTTLDNSKLGGWLTRHYLVNEKHWTKQLAKCGVINISVQANV